ncbi:protein of unknown function [Candidatus Filomicrobium marinum]|uniref:Uncharacterized protein n=1 Tax=Candidatus Filomicrobium marinum TaxID=1608628 RepID=A0A0D6JH87_9HYPH|nr:protein of unknown function [Candidatus Filomicrobium marinum]CPR20693.1 protein of unknown function [Candidatus Filomicrobium marinum]
MITSAVSQGLPTSLIDVGRRRGDVPSPATAERGSGFGPVAFFVWNMFAAAASQLTCNPVILAGLL